MLKRATDAIPKIEAHSAFAQQMWALAVWLGVPSLVGTAMSWFAAEADLLAGYAPFSWAAIGFGFAFMTAVTLALLGVWQERRSRARANDLLASEPKTINPLDMSFERVRIRAVDFFSPFGLEHVAKHFNHCEFIGPATIVLNRCFITNKENPFRFCNYVIIRRKVRAVASATVFRDCSFNECYFYRCTIMFTGADGGEVVLNEDYVLSRDVETDTPSPLSTGPETLPRTSPG